MKKRISCLAFAATLLLCVLSLAPKTAVADSGTDLLQLLPDGTAVAVVDVQRFLASSVWAELSAQEKTRHAIESLESDLADLGMTMSDIRSVAASFGGSLKSATVAVGGNFDQTALINRIRADVKVKLTTETYKGYEINTVQPADPSSKRTPTSFVFFDAGTAVVGSKAATQAAIETKLGGRSIAQNQQLNDALNQNPVAAIRFAMALTPEMSAKLQSTELPLPDFSSIKLIWAAVDVTSNVDLVATLRNDSAEHAKAVAERLNGLVSMFRGFIGSTTDPKMSGVSDALKSVTIVDSDVDVKITGSVSVDLLKTILGAGTATVPMKKL
jgi:hypothetical protein